MCLFVKQPKRQLMTTKEGSLSGTGTSLATWLRDTLLSSKSAELRLSGYGASAELLSRTLHLVEDPEEAEAKDGHVWHRFSTTVPAQELSMRDMILLVATTEDQTDAEKQVVLLKLIPHPPPMLLSQNVTKAFFVPDYDIAQQRTYAACNVAGNPSLVEGHVPDTRFKVETKVVILGQSCLGGLKEQKRFRAVRTDQSCAYCQNYLPWNVDYDVAATFSYEQCLYAAIDLRDDDKLQKIATTMNYHPDLTSSCYEVIPRAIQVGRTDTTMLKTLLDSKFDPSCAGCPEMPMQTAASGGFVSAMEMLLDWNFVLFRNIQLVFLCSSVAGRTSCELQPKVFAWYVFWFSLFQLAICSALSTLFKAQDDLTRSKISCFFESDCWLSLATNVGSISINFLLFDPTQVRRKADVNAMDAKNGTAFLRASQHCQLGALQLLLDHGAAVDQLVAPPSTRVCLWRRMISWRMHFCVMPGWCIDDVDDFWIWFSDFFGRWFLYDARMTYGLFLVDLRVAQSVFSYSLFPRCWVTPLVYLLGAEVTKTCAEGHQVDVIRMLLKNGAKLSYQAPWQIFGRFLIISIA